MKIAFVQMNIIMLIQQRLYVVPPPKQKLCSDHVMLRASDTVTCNWNGADPIPADLPLFDLQVKVHAPVPMCKRILGCFGWEKPGTVVQR